MVRTQDWDANVQKVKICLSLTSQRRILPVSLYNVWNDHGPAVELCPSAVPQHQESNLYSIHSPPGTWEADFKTSILGEMRHRAMTSETEKLDRLGCHYILFKVLILSRVRWVSCFLSLDKTLNGTECPATEIPDISYCHFVTSLSLGYRRKRHFWRAALWLRSHRPVKTSYSWVCCSHVAQIINMLWTCKEEIIRYSQIFFRPHSYMEIHPIWIEFPVTPTRTSWKMRGSQIT